VERTQCTEKQPKKKASHLADIILAGTGIMGTMQMTRETEYKLRECDVVYVLHYDDSVVRCIENWGVEVVDARSFYVDGKHRSEVYLELAEAILQTAQTRHVGFLVHGHPLFLVSTSEAIVELAPAKGLAVEILPGVSSLDTVMADLRIDFGHAMQGYEANFLLNKHPVIEPRVPLMIYQVAILGAYKVNRVFPGANLQPLTDYLSNHYPAEHQVAFILSSKHALLPAELVWMPIYKLHLVDQSLLEGRPTLYVPPLREIEA